MRNKKYHGWRTYLFAAVFTCLGALTGQSQTLHLISAAATDDPAIQYGAASNRKAVRDNFFNITNTLGIALDDANGASDINGRNFSCATLDRAIGQLAPSPDDIIVFYYAGHGERGSNQISPLPSLACDVGSGGTRDLLRVIDTLARKPGRLKILIIDACNRSLPSPPSVAGAAAPAPSLNKAALKRLFLDPSGLIVLVATSPGEYSFYFTDGSRFTERVLQLLTDPSLANAGSSWEALLVRATQPIVIAPGPFYINQTKENYGLNGAAVVQTPQVLARITRP